LQAMTTSGDNTCWLQGSGPRPIDLIGGDFDFRKYCERQQQPGCSRINGNDESINSQHRGRMWACMYHSFPSVRRPYARTAFCSVGMVPRHSTPWTCSRDQHTDSNTMLPLWNCPPITIPRTEVYEDSSEKSDFSTEHTKVLGEMATVPLPRDIIARAILSPPIPQNRPPIPQKLDTVPKCT
jgi:hypothetical protein